MWRYTLCALIGAIATVFAWSVLVHNSSVKESAWLIAIVIFGLAIFTAEAIGEYVWGRKQSAESTLDGKLRKNKHMRHKLGFLGLVMGMLLTISGYLLFEHGELWMIFMPVIAFAISCWIIEFYLKRRYGQNAAEQVSGGDS